jgi:hypothetical protein
MFDPRYAEFWFTVVPVNVAFEKQLYKPPANIDAELSTITESKTATVLLEA